MADALKSRNWGDEAESPEAPTYQDYVQGPDANGIKTYVHFEKQEDGKVLKITRKFHVVTKKSKVLPGVAERKKWVKFGQAAKNSPATENTTSYTGDEVSLDIRPVVKVESVPIPTPEIISVTCRICGAVGLHFTNKCPFADRVEAVGNPLASAAAAADIATSKPGKYVPPSIRNQMDSSKSGDSLSSDTHVLRVSNLSPDARDSDVRELFSRFGPMTKVYVNQYANRRVAFVHFIHKDDAEKAMSLNGYGYDHLILEVGWAKQR